MILAAFLAGGVGVLFLLCGACTLIERYQRAHLKRRRYKFADSSHVLKDSERVQETWNTGDNCSWVDGGIDCGGGGGIE